MNDVLGVSHNDLDTVIATLVAGLLIVLAVLVNGHFTRKVMREESQKQIDQRNQLERLRREYEEKREEKRFHPDTLERQACELAAFAEQLVRNPRVAVNARLAASLIVLKARENMLQTMSLAYTDLAVRLRQAERTLSNNPRSTYDQQVVEALLAQQRRLSEMLDEFNGQYAAVNKEFDQLSTKVIPAAQ